MHFLKLGTKASGVYNAGFENISILDIAKKVTKHFPAEIEITESNDPRSYRQNSEKLLGTGFTPQYCVDNAIKDLIHSYRSGNLEDEDHYYNIRAMKRLENIF